MTEFVAAWGDATEAGHNLLIDPRLFHALNLSKGEPVEVLL